MTDSLITLAFGIIAVLASYGKIQLSKDPQKNAEYLSKYGMLIRILGIILIVMGAVLLFAR